MPDLYAKISAVLRAAIESSKAAAADGKITWSEAMAILADVVKHLVFQAAGLDLSGPDKKSAVMTAVGQAFDALAAVVDIPYIPEPIESMVVEPALKKGVLLFASGLIEIFVKQLPAASETV